MDRRDPSDNVLAGLWRLANTPFRLADFQVIWRELGWQWTASSSDEFGFQVEVPRAYPLWVDPLGAEIICARLAVACMSSELFPNPFDDAPLSERDALDHAYLDLRGRIIAFAGEPQREWRDVDECGYRATIWRTPHGVFIVQQASLDPQFGDEVDVWIDGVSYDDLKCETPLVDALCRRSQSLHDERGFPPLPTGAA
jgi:hypothetical protein